MVRRRSATYPDAYDDFRATEVETAETISKASSLFHKAFHFISMFHHSNGFVGIEVGLVRGGEAEEGLAGVVATTLPDVPPRRSKKQLVMFSSFRIAEANKKTYSGAQTKPARMSTGHSHCTPKGMR